MMMVMVMCGKAHKQCFYLRRQCSLRKLKKCYFSLCPFCLFALNLCIGVWDEVGPTPFSWNQPTPVGPPMKMMQMWLDCQCIALQWWWCRCEQCNVWPKPLCVTPSQLFSPLPKLVAPSSTWTKIQVQQINANATNFSFPSIIRGVFKENNRTIWVPDTCIICTCIRIKDLAIRIIQLDIRIIQKSIKQHTVQWCNASVKIVYTAM